VMADADGETFTSEEIRAELAAVHGIDRIEMEIAQPDRLDEVLDEMVRRDVIESVGDDEWMLVNDEA